MKNRLVEHLSLLRNQRDPLSKTSDSDVAKRHSIDQHLALLRIVDPQLKSKTLEDYGAAYLLIGPVEMLLYPAIIWACGADRYLALGITLTSIAFILFFVARLAAKGSPSVSFDAALPADSISRRTIC